MRYTVRNCLSGDYTWCLLPWTEYIRNNGIFTALGTRFTNYTPFYTYFLSFLSLFDAEPLYGIKIFSSIFDYITALIIYEMLKEITNSNIKANVGFACAIFAPTAILNGAVWGQCDSIYTCFTIASLYFIFTKKNYKIWNFSNISIGMILYGIAFSIKLQAIFVMPIYGLLWIKRRIKLWQFAFIPLIYVILIFPCLLLGRPIKDCLTIYISQMGRYGKFTLNYPNIWNYVTDGFEGITSFMIIFTFAILFISLYILIRYNEDFSLMILYVIFCVLICCYFLPHIHERYAYVAEILLICYAATNKKGIFLFLVTQIITALTYLHYLVGLNLSTNNLSAIRLIVIVIIGYDIFLEQTRSNLTNQGSPRPL